MPKKILSEAETRRNIIETARFFNCEGEVLEIFAKYDKLLRNCTNPIEREAIALAGNQEIHFLLNSKPGALLVNGKLIGN